jgi:hypothetical protein
MANRFPLVINNSSTLVGELQTGDALNLSANGIYDGLTLGNSGQVLASKGEINGVIGVQWVTPADVFLNATQTLTNKTLSSCTINFGQNNISAIPNSALQYSKITINDTDVSLGGSITLNDENDYVIYNLTTQSYNNNSKTLVLTGIDQSNNTTTKNIYFTTTTPSTLVISNNSSGDGFDFSVSLQRLTFDSATLKSSVQTQSYYDGGTQITLSVNATAGTAVDRGNSKIVSRNSSGNFYANIIYADVSGQVLDSTSNGYGKRTVSTEDPGNASGSDGDIWFVIS